jgi:Protein of unknown function (DUF3352)
VARASDSRASVRRVKAALIAGVAALAVAVSGCGSQTGAGSSDAASIAPASTLAYATFEIAPQGPEKAGFDAAFGKLLGPNPQEALGEAFTKAAATGGKLDYQNDVRPWLGNSISGVVTRVGRGSADYALLVASTDDARAQAAIDKDLSGTGAQSRTYRGVDYKVLSDGTVNAIVDHYLVAGTEPAFKQVVDTADGGSSLADSDQWKSSVGSRGDGKIGLAYIDAKALLESFASSLPGAQQLAGPFLIGLLQLHPFVGTLAAQADQLVADVSSPGTKPDPRGPAAASSKLIDAMPADSWLALAVPQVGQALTRIVQALKANPLVAAQYERVLAQVRASTGIDLEKDVLATVGDVGLFARGTTPKTVGGGLVVQSDHPAALAATVRKLPPLINANAHGRVRMNAASGGFDIHGRHALQPVEVRTTGQGAIATYGAAALRAARHPNGRLGDSSLFQKAATAVGSRPTLFVAFAPALQLAAASPHHKNDADFKQALPHLQHIDFVAVGARRDGGLDVLRTVIGIH